VGKESNKKKGPYRKRRGGSTYLWIFLAVGVLALWGWSEWAKPSRELPGLKTFAEEGRDHVADGSVITYKTDPPTSGPHYPVPTNPGFYTDPQPAGALVHSLEHGNIVIYYNPSTTPAAVIDQLKEYASKYTGTWDGVVVTPRQQEEQVVLTAWRNMLPLQTWDSRVADKFIDKFRGRGPENPVR
jgi:hypothetical protein